MNLSKGNLRLLEDKGRFLLERTKGEDYEGLSLDPDEFKWLALLAVPAIWNKHAPPPPDSILAGPSERTPIGPFDPPAINPGQLEIE